jgi:hypothetical protein
MWIRCKEYEVTKNRNLESVSAKNAILLLPTACLPTHLRVPVHKKIPFPAVETSPAAISSAQRVPRRTALLVGGPPDRSRAPAACARPRPPRCAVTTPPDASTAKEVGVRPAAVPHHDVQRRQPTAGAPCPSWWRRIWIKTRTFGKIPHDSLRPTNESQLPNVSTHPSISPGTIKERIFTNFARAGK